MNDRELQKRAAAERAADYVESGMTVGLGTGSTAKHVVDVIGERLRNGTLRNISGIPTSRTTAAHARQLGIPLLDPEDLTAIDLAIDGADEVDGALDLIKGMGGALLWEKIVESAARRFVVVADESKLVEQLGRRVPVPVEVVPFGWRALLQRFEAAGAVPALRRGDGGAPFVSDGGHYIIDCRFPEGITDAARTAASLRAPAGVVETGLFIGMADAVVVAGREVQVLTRSADVGPRSAFI